MLSPGHAEPTIRAARSKPLAATITSRALHCNELVAEPNRWIDTSGWRPARGRVAVAFINNLVHSRDAWTSVVPMGLTLSVLTIVLILVTAWLTAAGHRRHAIPPVEIR